MHSLYNLPVNIVFAIGRQIVVDDAGNLLHVNTTSKQISSDEYTRRARTELPHDHLTLALIHVTVHGRHGEVTLMHRLGQPVDL